MSSSPDLPQEILDLILDNLRAEPATLKACCLVSKSWVPPTRRLLFAHVRFHSVSAPFKSWMEHFPDPSTSPAYHTRSLSFESIDAITATNSDARPWIHSFCHIIELEVETTRSHDYFVSLNQLYGLSPALKSLSLNCAQLSLSEVFNFTCSFPLLENLTLRYYHPASKISGWIPPPTSPKLTGVLELSGQDSTITRALLDLPDGLRFSKIILSRHIGDAESIKELLSRCSDTLESLSIEHVPLAVNTRTPPPFDLSEYRKLNDVMFRVGSVGIGWVIMTLQAPKPESLRRVTVYSYGLPSDPEGMEEWRGLDRLLAGLWTSHSILSKVSCWDSLELLAPSLLPELSSKGIICGDACFDRVYTGREGCLCVGPWHSAP